MMRSARSSKWLPALAAALALAAPGTAAAEKWRNPAGDKWIEVRSPNFTLYGDVGSKRLRTFAEQLELFRKGLGHVTPGLLSESSTENVVFAFRNEARFAPYRDVGEDDADNLGGYFQPGLMTNHVAFDASSSSDPASVAYSGYVHALLSENFGVLPAWLAQGLARYYSTFKIKDFGRVMEVGHPLERDLRGLARGPRIPWNRVLGATRTSFANDGQKLATLQAQSWLLVHYLLSTPQGTTAINTYLSALRSTGAADLDVVLAQALGKNATELAAAVDRYREGDSFKYRVWDQDESETRFALSERALEDGEVLYLLGDLEARRGNVASADRHFAAAREAGYPEPPIAASSGYGAWIVDDPDQAEGLLRKSIEAGIDSPEPYVLLGRVLLSRFLDGSFERVEGEALPAAIEEARGFLEKGLAMRSGSYPALLGLAYVHRVAGTPEAGLAVTNRGLAVRPIDLELGRLQVCFLADTGRHSAAWSLVANSLRPRDAATARHAGDCVEQAVIAHARDLARLDRLDEATAVLADAIAFVDEPERIGRIGELHKVVASGSAPPETSENPAVVERFNRGIELANAQKYEEALAEMEAVLAIVEEGSIRERATEIATELRDVVSHNRFVESINEIVALVNGGELEEAASKAEALAANEQDPERSQKIAELLESIRAREGS